MRIKPKFLIGSFLITAIILVAATDPGKRYFEMTRSLDIFTSLYKEVNEIYVDEINPSLFMKTGVDAMLETLDPYTNYIPEDQVEDYRTQTTGQYGGIGALTRTINGAIRVSNLIEGFSAEKNGLKIGDHIIAIDGKDITSMDADDISLLMKGQLNTTMNLRVVRYGHDEPLNLSFKREKIQIESIPYSGILDDNIGYVKLNSFAVNAGKDINRAVEELKKEGATGIILDLRGNPGGLLHEAVNLVNIFIPKNQLVVTTRGRLSEQVKEFKTLQNPLDTEIPVVVLLNANSASASEIVAGTLQDYDRGVIIGQESFGKGLVQVNTSLSYNSMLKITTAKYYTPSGRCIQSLNYSERSPDGSVFKIPDSLRGEFSTKNGRTVYDGGGIMPDVLIESPQDPSILRVLHQKGLLFDYSDHFFYNNKSVEDPLEFSITKDRYAGFVDWVSPKDYGYETLVEEKIEKLQRYAEKERYHEEIKEEMAFLKSSVLNSKANDLENFKSDIKKALAEEILNRYYLESGVVQHSLKNDEEVNRAIQILKSPEVYHALLK